MRVKDPLQGIKSLKGHTVMHVCFYISALYVARDIPKEQEIEDNILIIEKNVFLLVHWGHLVSAILQLLAFFFKARGSHFMQKMLNFCLNVTYLLP